MLHVLDMFVPTSTHNEPSHLRSYVQDNLRLIVFKDVYIDLQISDHYVLSFRVEIENTTLEQKIITFRKT